MSTIATTSQPATSSSLKRLLTDHPLVTFFVIAFAGAWIVFLPLLLARNGLGLLPFSLTRGRLSYRPSHEAMPVEDPQPTEAPMASA